MITHAKVKQIQKHGKKALAPPAPISPASRASCLALTGPIEPPVEPQGSESGEMMRNVSFHASVLEFEYVLTVPYVYL